MSETEEDNTPYVHPDEMLISLNPPITFNGKTVDVIALKEPTVAQVEQADKVTVNGVLNLSNMRKYQTALISAVSGQPTPIVGQMKISDVNKAFEYLMVFIARSQTTI